MAIARTNGIFSLETEWEEDIRKHYSVEHILRLVQEADKSTMDYIQRRVATGSSLLFYLRKWCEDIYAGYPILYLAMHGEPGRLLMENWKAAVLLDGVIDVLRGKCRGRVIYISACEVLKSENLRKLRRETQALAVIGYVNSTDWVNGSIVDYLVLSALARGKLTPGSRLKKRVLTQLNDTIQPRILREFGFRMEVG